MILLQKQDYHKVTEHLRQITVNHLFARFIIEQKVDGKVFVDNPDNPTTFYILHPYSMSLLFGNVDNTEFNSALVAYLLNTDKHRQTFEWLQAPEKKWQAFLSDTFGDRFVAVEENRGAVNDKIEITTRVNFKFNKEKFEAISAMTPVDKQVVRTDTAHYDAIQGAVIPENFWNNRDDFFENGVGFTSLSDNEVASTAFSSFIFDDTLEIGIETAQPYKGKGYAFAACSALINYCIEKNYEPVWSCKKDNIGSYRLACRLGFEPTLTLPFYRLNY
ncbi:MAG: GNAT family N-acetyltransferase [Bacteroidota bacterium]|nr:GNAT family N-acetyltransferase [Bacteroidota bacterium]